jgi:PIN domain
MAPCLASSSFLSSSRTARSCSAASPSGCSSASAACSAAISAPGRGQACAPRGAPMPVDEHVADELAELLVKLRAAQRRANAFDCFVAATALAHDLTVVAQDADFQELQATEPRLSVALV